MCYSLIVACLCSCFNLTFLWFIFIGIVPIIMPAAQYWNQAFTAKQFSKYIEKIYNYMWCNVMLFMWKCCSGAFEVISFGANKNLVCRCLLLISWHFNRQFRFTTIYTFGGRTGRRTNGILTARVCVALHAVSHLLKIVIIPEMTVVYEWDVKPLATHSLVCVWTSALKRKQSMQIFTRIKCRGSRFW